MAVQHALFRKLASVYNVVGSCTEECTGVVYHVGRQQNVRWKLFCSSSTFSSRHDSFRSDARHLRVCQQLLCFADNQQLMLIVDLQIPAPLFWIHAVF